MTVDNSGERRGSDTSLGLIKCMGSLRLNKLFCHFTLLSNYFPTDMRNSNSNETFKIILTLVFKLNPLIKNVFDKIFLSTLTITQKGEFPLFLRSDLCQLSYLLIQRCLYQSSHWPLAETQHSALKVFDLMTDSFLFLWITSHDCNRPVDWSTERAELMHIRFLTLLPVWV